MAKAEADAAKIQLLEARIKAPSIWGRVPCGLRFEDLQERRYDDAVRLVRKHYMTEEITYKSVKMTEDQEGADEFIHNVRIWMKDKMSIAVVKEATDKLVGVLIMRIQEKVGYSRTFSRVKLQYNPLFARVMKFYNELEAPVDLFKELDVRRYLKIYILALKPRYRHRGIAKDMLKAAMELAASAFIPALAGIFTTGRLQTIAIDLGFEKFNEIYYIRYLVDGQIVFWDIGVGNYGAAIMGYRIPEVDEPADIILQSTSRFVLDHDIDDEVTEEESTKTPVAESTA